MILVDTSVWIGYLNGEKSWQTDKLDQVLNSGQVMIGDIILMEILQGIRNDRDYRTLKKKLLKLPLVNLCEKKIALKSAENYRLMRKKGLTIRSSIDLIIATFCSEHKLPLLHIDRDFELFSKFIPLELVSEN